MFGPEGSFDVIAQVGVYGFWAVLLVYYFVSAIGQTLRDRPELEQGTDVAQWATLLVIQAGLTGGVIYLAIGIGSNQIGL